MNKEEFFSQISKECEKINIKLNEKQKEQFYKYMNLLIEWNSKINLTTIIEPKEIIIKHFIDSLTIYKNIEQMATLIDVGTGAGFPGIPIKILNPSIEVTLIDSLNKRINFLNEVIKKLELTNIKAIHTRVEEIAKNKNYREKYDIATARAVSNLTTLSEYLLPLVKIGGICICMKGSEIEEEIENSKNAIKILGGKIEGIKYFEISEEKIQRNIIIIKKEKNTPSKYPRKAGTPAKEPLK